MPYFAISPLEIVEFDGEAELPKKNTSPHFAGYYLNPDERIRPKSFINRKMPERPMGYISYHILDRTETPYTFYGYMVGTPEKKCLIKLNPNHWYFYLPDLTETEELLKKIG